MPHVHSQPTTSSAAWQKADVRVLGQILAAQNIMFALPDTARVAEFYAQTLISIPGITGSRVCLGGQSIESGQRVGRPCVECDRLRTHLGTDGQLIPANSNLKCGLTEPPNIRAVAIQSYQHHFGYFVFKLNEAAAFEVYEPFIRNLANEVAILLENRWQKDMLRAARDDMERKVEERTRDLTAANAELRSEIAERQRAESRVKRLNRLYATLSQINQTIVHVRDRAALLEQICRVAVEHGQFRMAWISRIDEATGRVVPAVFAGEELGYLTDVQISSLDEPRGRGPTGTAMREGRCIICQDIATDPRMQFWRDAALQRGFRSTAAVPFSEHGRVTGALTVYSAESHSIDAEDKDLLDEISLDISFALDRLEQEAQRQRAEAELSRLNAELEQRVSDRTAELARAHERLQAILDTAGEGVVFTDSLGKIEYINPAMERLTGYPAEEALGHNPRLWKSDQTPPVAYAGMWDALLRGEIWQGEVVNRRKDGTLYNAALTASPVADIDGQTVGYVGVQRDITRQKELEQLKDQFVSTVSHELRTPLSNVMLYINLLTRGRPERRDIYLRTLQREAERLRRMIEDLLDLSRLDRNVTPIELAPTDVHQLLDALVNDRAELAAQRGLVLRYEPASDLPVIASDSSKLTQVVSNLLTNALHYTPSGGEVIVSSAQPHTADRCWVTITVRDTGPGIAPKELAHLFERFFRGEAGRHTDAPGTGLGLAISQEIMHRLGGRISVDSELGHGAAFTIWLKADEDPQTE